MQWPFKWNELNVMLRVPRHLLLSVIKPSIEYMEVKCGKVIRVMQVLWNL